MRSCKHVTGFRYDGAGNVTNDGANTYQYDAEGRPITVGSVQTTFDAFGRAVEQNNGSAHKPGATPKPVLLGWGLSSYITDSVPGSVYAALGPSARRIRAFENEWELQVHGAMGNWGTWTRDQPLPPNQKKVGWGTRRYLRAGLMRVYI